MQSKKAQTGLGVTFRKRTIGWFYNGEPVCRTLKPVFVELTECTAWFDSGNERRGYSDSLNNSMLQVVRTSVFFLKMAILRTLPFNLTV